MPKKVVLPSLKRTSKEFNTKNAIVTHDSQCSVVDLMTSRGFNQAQKYMAFDWTNVINCDLERRQVILNLMLHDIFTLKVQNLSIFIDLLPEN